MTAVIDRYRDEDAAALAVMWNESNTSWPGGFNAGPPYDAARIREWIAAHDALTRLIARADGSIIGYCDLAAEGPDAIYIPLLNVHPRHHGRGVGRDLLLRALAEAAGRDGCRRVHLKTWPANAGAIPLYKKVGFFWEPGTSVEMVNHLPEVFRHPSAAAYFRRHDWYRTQQRDLSSVEDDERWHGLPAHTYRFSDGDDHLSVVIDRVGNCIAAIETPRLSVQGWRARTSALPGMRMPVNLSVMTAVGPVSVTVSSDTLRFEQLLPADLVGEGDVRTVLVPVGAKPCSGACPTARPAVLRIDVRAGDACEWVEAAVPVSAPVSFDYAGDRVLRPGRQGRLNFRLANRLSEPVHVRVDVTAIEGLALVDGESPQTTLFSLAAGASDGFDMRVFPKGPDKGAIRFRITADVDGVRHDENFTIDFLIPERGSSGVLETPAAAWLANDFVTVCAGAEGLTVADRLADRPAVRLTPSSFGPPFVETVALGGPEVRRVKNGWEIGLVAGSEPGLSIRQAVSASGPVVTVRGRVTNEGTASIAVPLLRHAIWSLLRDGQLAAPLAEGLSVADVVAGEYPLGQDYRDEPGLLGEQWLAAWDADGAAGFVSDGAPQTVFWSRCLAQLTHSLPELAPGEQLDLPELHIYVGPGDWRPVRALWLATIGGSAADIDAPRPKPVTGVSILPQPAIVGRQALALRVENRRDTPLSGRLAVTAGPGWRAEPSAFDFRAARRGAPCDQPIDIRPGGGVGAASIGLEMKSGGNLTRTAQPVFAIESGGEVGVVREADGDWLIDNGRLTARVAPRFAGSLRSLRDRGRELMKSAFPAPASFVDIAPWYGGLHPQTSCSRGDWPGCGHRERYSVEPVSVNGTRGFAWRGLRVAVCAPAGAPPDDALPSGIERSVDLLTLPGSNLLAVITRVVNTTGGDIELAFGFDAYPERPPGSGLSHVGPTGAVRTRTAESGHATLSALDWVSVDAAASDSSLAFIARGKPLRVDDYGLAGVLVSNVVAALVPAHGMSERIGLLVVARNADEAFLYRELTDLTALP